MPIESEPPVRRRSNNLAQGVVEALTQRILLGQLKPGEKLPPESTIVRTQVKGAERGGVDFAQLGRLANLEHEAIFNAIKRQHLDAARAAMVLHLANSRYRFCGE